MSLEILIASPPSIPEYVSPPRIPYVLPLGNELVSMLTMKSMTDVNTKLGVPPLSGLKLAQSAEDSMMRIVSGDVTVPDNNVPRTLTAVVSAGSAVELVVPEGGFTLLELTAQSVKILSMVWQPSAAANVIDADGLA